MSNSTTVKQMMESAVHFGHKTQKWNPKMKKYIFGERTGIHIFDLEKTAECLDKAVEFVKMSVSSGKRVLLVSTKPQASHLIVDAANAAHMPYVVHKWMGGLLTNYSTMKQRIRYYKNLVDQEKNGEFDKYTKKEAADLRKQIKKLDDALGGVRDLDKLPDLVFVADAVRDRIVVKEANKMKIPVVAICDSNCDPDGIAYPIPGNDDAVKSLTYLIKAIKDAMVKAKA